MISSYEILYFLVICKVFLLSRYESIYLMLMQGHKFNHCFGYQIFILMRVVQFFTNHSDISIRPGINRH